MISAVQYRPSARDIAYPRDGAFVMRLLIIEDDRDAADYLAKAFREVGHVADLAADGEEGLAHALDGQYDVLVVDRMLPKLDGLTLIGTLRKKNIETPALILSALGQVDDRVKGLRAGGDDYLPKPYSFSELLARIEVLARRRGSREETVYRVGDLELDRLSHRVTRTNQEIDLQPREFRLLEYLMKHAGQVVTRTMLLENVWDYHFDPQTNVIDVHISRLRSKIDKGFAQPLLHPVPDGSGWPETAYRKLEDLEQTEHHALVKIVQLSGGFRMLVGRDLEERDRMHDVVIGAGRWSLAIVVILGIAGGLFVMRRVLQR